MDIQVHRLTTKRDSTDEYVTEGLVEFPLKNPESFSLFGTTFTVDRIRMDVGSWAAHAPCCLSSGEVGLTYSGPNEERFDFIPISPNLVWRIYRAMAKASKLKDSKLFDYDFHDDFTELLQESKKVVIVALDPTRIAQVEK